MLVLKVKTKIVPYIVDNKHDNDDLTLLQTHTNVVFAIITDFQDYLPTRQISTAQTGNYPILSNRGNQCIVVMYDYGSNAILVEPMNSKSTTETIAKYTIRVDIKPLYQKLDN